MVSASEINAIGTLLLAIIALFAIFYPQINKYVLRPKFSFELVSKGTPPAQVQTVFVRVTNKGRRVAHGVVGLIEVKDDTGFTLLRERIPIRKHTELYSGETLYPLERVLFLFMLNGSYKTGLPDSLIITSYPFVWGESATPSLTSMSSIGKTEIEKYIKEGKTYETNIFVGSEDLSRMSKYSFSFIYKNRKINFNGQNILSE